MTDRINYVLLASGSDGAYHKSNGEAMTWGQCVEAIGAELHRWIDHDGINIRIIAISATRDPMEREKR